MKEGLWWDLFLKRVSKVFQLLQNTIGYAKKYLFKIYNDESDNFGCNWKVNSVMLNIYENWKKWLIEPSTFVFGKSLNKYCFERYATVKW